MTRTLLLKPPAEPLSITYLVVLKKGTVAQWRGNRSLAAEGLLLDFPVNCPWYVSWSI